MKSSPQREPVSSAVDDVAPAVLATDLDGTLIPLDENPEHRTDLDLLQGTLDLIILQLLQGGPTNGWDLTLRIQATSKDVLSVNAGSLYPALYRLESKGLIKATWKTTAKNRRAKVYTLTAKGRRQLVAERTTWERFSGALTAILGSTGRANA